MQHKKVDEILSGIRESISTGGLMGGGSGDVSKNDDFYARGDSRIPVSIYGKRKKRKKKVMKEEIDLADYPKGDEIQNLIPDKMVLSQVAIKLIGSGEKNKWNFKTNLQDLIDDTNRWVTHNKKYTFNYDFKSFIESHNNIFEEEGVIFIGVQIDGHKLSLISAKDGEIILTLS